MTEQNQIAKHVVKLKLNITNYKTKINIKSKHIK